MNPPMVCALTIPRSHRTRRITKIVQSIDLAAPFGGITPEAAALPGIASNRYATRARTGASWRGTCIKRLTTP